MKKITIVTIVLAAFLAVQFLGATQAVAAKVETEKGTRALVFQFSGLSSLGAGAYKSGIGMRYYIQPGLALRPGLQFDYASETTKTQLSGYSDAKDKMMAMGINLAVEKHAPGMGSLSPYIGAIAGFSIYNNSSEPSLPGTIPTGTWIKGTEKGMNIGVGGLAGFEWGFSEGVTLGAEYVLGLYIGSGKEENEYQGQATQTSDDMSDMGLGFGTASFYLSVNW